MIGSHSRLCNDFGFFKDRHEDGVNGTCNYTLGRNFVLWSEAVTQKRDEGLAKNLFERRTNLLDKWNYNFSKFRHVYPLPHDIVVQVLNEWLL